MSGRLVSLVDSSSVGSLISRWSTYAVSINVLILPPPWKQGAGIPQFLDISPRVNDFSTTVGNWVAHDSKDSEKEHGRKFSLGTFYGVAQYTYTIRHGRAHEKCFNVSSTRQAPVSSPRPRLPSNGTPLQEWTTRHPLGLRLVAWCSTRNNRGFLVGPRWGASERACGAALCEGRMLRLARIGMRRRRRGRRLLVRCCFRPRAGFSWERFFFFHRGGVDHSG